VQPFGFIRVAYSMGNRAEYCRRQARECMALAHRISGQPSREQLKEISEQWSRLAKFVERLDEFDINSEQH
jgi:hypothetical protein